MALPADIMLVTSLLAAAPQPSLARPPSLTRHLMPVVPAAPRPALEQLAGAEVGNPSNTSIGNRSGTLADPRKFQVRSFCSSHKSHLLVGTFGIEC